jgi:hypothetical protein
MTAQSVSMYADRLNSGCIRKAIDSKVPFHASRGLA